MDNNSPAFSPDTWTTARTTGGPSRVPLDTHEIMKQQMFRSDVASCDDHFEKNLPCPTAIYGAQDTYLTLDSFVKLPESDIARGRYKWNFSIQGTTGTEFIGVKNAIENVIHISMGCFSVPFLEDVPYILTPTPYGALPNGINSVVQVQNNNNAANPLLPDSPVLVPDVPAGGTVYGQYPLSTLIPPLVTTTPFVNNPLSQVPFSSKMTIFLEELGLQSFSDRGGARHHFDYALRHPALIGANPNVLQAIPLGGGEWGGFNFTEPIQAIHGLTLVFRNPDVPIRFLPDVYQQVQVAGDASAGVAPGNFLRFTTPEPHHLNVGDRIYVTGLSTGNAALDALVNRADGWVASADPNTAPPYPNSGEPIPTPTQFWTDPALSIINLTAPVPSLPKLATVYVAKRRLLIPLRIRGVVDRLTNYMTL